MNIYEKELVEKQLKEKDEMIEQLQELTELQGLNCEKLERKLQGDPTLSHIGSDGTETLEGKQGREQEFLSKYIKKVAEETGKEVIGSTYEDTMKNMCNKF